MEHTTEPTAERLWDDVSGRLREALNETTYATWFGYASAGELVDDTFSLVVPNDFTREWIEGNFLGFVKAAARDALARDIRVTLTVREPGGARRGAASPALQALRSMSGRPPSPKYTFDLFVIGSSNRFAHAAALAVAEAPAQAYNPLFIYGGTGLGKTHLLQAIGQYVSEHTKGSTTRYVTSETFMNDFINSLRDKRIEGFKQRYRTYDVLLVDDIQFFEGKERIQEEFFHTFNSLYEAGRQIVISSDRPPKEIATLEERLRSRFEWGLITDIQPPDLETRIAILRKKVTTDRIGVEDPRGAHVHRRSCLHEHPRARGGADKGRRVLVADRAGPDRRARRAGAARPVPPRRRRPRRHDQPDPGGGLRPLRALDHRALQPAPLPGGRVSSAGRDVLSRELTDASLPKIGKEFGGRDHTTVIHATTKITRLISEDRSVYNLVQDLTARIKQTR